MAGRFLDDRVGLRFAFWFAVALVITGLCDSFRVSFPGSRAIELVTAKLAFLALIAAVAIFQYGIWRQLAERTFDSLNNPAWATFQAQVERDETLATANTTALPGDFHARKAALDAWLAWKKDRVNWMLSEFLPHSRIILTNYISATYFLFVSSLIDLVSVLLRVETSLTGAISAATLLATAPPFAEVWARYAASLGLEFAEWKRQFVEATPKVPE